MVTSEVKNPLHAQKVVKIAGAMRQALHALALGLMRK